jgi:hypothetical protein
MLFDQSLSCSEIQTLKFLLANQNTCSSTSSNKVTQVESKEVMVAALKQ